MPKVRSAMECLEDVVSEYAENICNYTTTPTAFTRNRKLNAETMLKVTLNMQGQSLNAELLDAFADEGKRMSASAYVQAKGKLTPKLFEDMFYSYNHTMANPKKLTISDSYRVFAIDGSAFNVPYSPDSKYVVKASENNKRKDGTAAKPYSILYAHMMLDLVNRTYHDCIIETWDNKNERDAAIEMTKRLDVGKSIVIMDRGYEGFNMIENCNRTPDLFYLIRARAGGGGIKEIGELPDEECDKDILFRITTSTTVYQKNRDKNYHYVQAAKTHYKQTRSKYTNEHRWDFEDYTEVKCRAVKFRIKDEDGKDCWEVLLTNLNRFEFPIDKLKELYHLRWDIETSFRDIKYALGAVNFHSKKDDFIKMELFSHFIMFNAVSRNINEIEVPQKETRKHQYAIDFKMASILTRRYFRIDNSPSPENLLKEMLKYLVPIRPGRRDKRHMKNKTAVAFVYRVA